MWRVRGWTSHTHSHATAVFQARLSLLEFIRILMPIIHFAKPTHNRIGVILDLFTVQYLKMTLLFLVVALCVLVSTAVIWSISHFSNHPINIIFQ